MKRIRQRICCSAFWRERGERIDSDSPRQCFFETTDILSVKEGAVAEYERANLAKLPQLEPWKDDPWDIQLAVYRRQPSKVSYIVHN